MGNRLDLQQELEDLLGSRNVYFNPPESLQLKYPCIVYHRMSGNTLRADNKAHRFTMGYRVVYIDRDPDSDMVVKLATHFPMMTHDSFYVEANLNHDAYTLYY